MSTTQVEFAILVERLIAIAARKDTTASNDSERLFQIRLLLIQFMDNNQ